MLKFTGNKIEIKLKDETTLDLEALGLTVRKVGDCWICRTQLGNLLVVDHSKDEFFGDEVWRFETYNNPTIHCFDKFESLKEDLSAYLGK